MPDYEPSNQLKRFPRNVWTRFLAVMRYADIGEFYQAKKILEGTRYHFDVNDEIYNIYAHYLEYAEKKFGAVKRVNIPSDYLKSDNPLLLKPFRMLNSDKKVPGHYPWSMALPSLIGAENDVTFLKDSASVLSGTFVSARKRLLVCYTPLLASIEDINKTLESISKLSFDGHIDTFLFGATAEIDTLYPSGVDNIHKFESPLLTPNSIDILKSILPKYDLVLFLSGSAEFDTLALQRALHVAEVSDRVIQPLIGLEPDSRFGSWLNETNAQSIFAQRYAFRFVCGLNFIVSKQLLEIIGFPDSQFSNILLAGRELAYRAYIRGAYFMPLTVPALNQFDDNRDLLKNQEFFLNKCPNHLDRQFDGSFTVPKVSVYIPAYNASKYIERAVASVLEQSVKDVDVCIANDGSSDETLALLLKKYGNERRVKVLDIPNGGIGFASNNAIRMSDSLYIGQLDSDDRLKPGAIRRLMTYLDENPTAVCAYGSCERIDKNGQYIKDEYSWPIFSREKMMVTSIVHHFRMFHRYAWERTTGFREDIANAVDYDIFLKLSEIGEFHHIDEKLYQRRWHGENTSNLNEHLQTKNTHRVQREALKRLGMSRSWEMYLPDPALTRKVSYRLKQGTQVLMFWPDYSRTNPYQKLLYRSIRSEAEVISGDINSAVKFFESNNLQTGEFVFHLHWLNAVFFECYTADMAQTSADNFVDRIRKFIGLGGRFIWTIHNTISHESPFPDIERALSEKLTKLAHKLHFHSASSIGEVASAFPIPRSKVTIARHGNYIGAYPDYITRTAAREALNFSSEDDIVLFTGQIRGYKGIDTLVTAFRRILADRPKARLVLAGKSKSNFSDQYSRSLEDVGCNHVHIVDRFIEGNELQVFMHAADFAVYPYEKVLTSGSLLLALSFGVPTVIPRVGMTAEVLDGREAGVLYEGAGGVEALEKAMRRLFAIKDEGGLPTMRMRAKKVAEDMYWQDIKTAFDFKFSKIEN